MPDRIHELLRPAAGLDAARGTSRALDRTSRAASGSRGGGGVRPRSTAGSSGSPGADHPTLAAVRGGARRVCGRSPPGSSSSRWRCAARRGSCHELGSSRTSTDHAARSSSSALVVRGWSLMPSWHGRESRARRRRRGGVDRDSGSTGRPRWSSRRPRRGSARSRSPGSASRRPAASITARHVDGVEVVAGFEPATARRRTSSALLDLAIPGAWSIAIGSRRRGPGATGRLRDRRGGRGSAVAGALVARDLRVGPAGRSGSRRPGAEPASR